MDIWQHDESTYTQYRIVKDSKLVYASYELALVYFSEGKPTRIISTSLNICEGHPQYLIDAFQDVQDALFLPVLDYRTLTELTPPLMVKE